MDGRPGTPSGEARQRWRLVFAREADAVGTPASDALTRWAAALLAAGIPVARSQGRATRPRLMFAAPLPASVPGERELVDLVLTERLTRADLRERLERSLPAGHRLVDLFDVWVGAPNPAAQLAAADYRVTVRIEDADVTVGPDPRSRLRSGCEALLAAPVLRRSRPKGEDRTVAYDLRPLIDSLSVGGSDEATPDAGLELRMRLRLGGEGGSGRPDEVVRALGEQIGLGLIIDATVRERLLMSDEVGPGPPADQGEGPDPVPSGRVDAAQLV